MCVIKITCLDRTFKNESVLKGWENVSFHDKGERRFRASGRLTKTYGVNIFFSDGGWDQFDQQVCDAVRFLDQHGTLIRRLLSNREQIRGFIDFAVWASSSNDTVVSSFKIEPDLTAHLGSLGLGVIISCYKREEFDRLESRS